MAHPFLKLIDWNELIAQRVAGERNPMVPVVPDLDVVFEDASEEPEYLFFQSFFGSWATFCRADSKV